MAKKIKFNNNSEFRIKKIIGEFIEDGKKYLKAAWYKYDKDINLGSLKNPLNTDVIEFEWIDKRPPYNPLARFFS